MLRKAVVAGVAVALIAVGLYRFGGLRVSSDGTGLWPRFLWRESQYAALEADRARQREQGPQPQSADAGPDKARPTYDAGANVGRTTSAGRTPDVGRTLSGPPSGLDTPAGSGPPSGFASPTGARRGYWPDFRGPSRDGRYDEAPIRTNWPVAGLPRLWKQPIGLGYASFVAAEGRAFTIEQRRRQEVVTAYDVETGRELWTHGWDGEFVEIQGGDGPRATPTYHEGRIYALGALGELRCLDAATGALVWRRNILTDAGAQNLDWGMAASPLIVDDKVIVLPGGPGGKSVAAYDKLTGAPVWTALDDRQAYTSPMLVTLGGVRQILVVSATRAIGITAENGRLLWEYSWATGGGINVAQPLLVGNDRVFLSAGYDHGAAVLQVAREGEVFSARTVWKNTRMKNKFTSSVLHEGAIYGLDEAILACVDLATGALKWKGGRYGYGQVLLTGDHLIVLAENGDAALVRATPEHYDEIAKFPAIEGKTWNHPIIVNGRLLVRNLREMAAFDIRP